MKDYPHQIPDLTDGLHPAMRVLFSRDVAPDEYDAMRKRLKYIGSLPAFGEGYSVRRVTVSPEHIHVTDFFDDGFAPKSEGMRQLELRELDDMIDS